MNVWVQTSVKRFEGPLNRRRQNSDVTVGDVVVVTPGAVAQVTRVPVDGAAVGDDEQEEDDGDEDGERQQDKDERENCVNPLEHINEKCGSSG